jgi:hypothetical protein
LLLTGTSLFAVARRLPAGLATAERPDEFTA